jgi:hypothetical protein
MAGLDQKGLPRRGVQHRQPSLDVAFVQPAAVQAPQRLLHRRHVRNRPPGAHLGEMAPVVRHPQGLTDDDVGRGGLENRFLRRGPGKLGGEPIGPVGGGTGVGQGSMQSGGRLTHSG